jgi:hypothetical protein
VTSFSNDPSLEKVLIEEKLLEFTAVGSTEAAPIRRQIGGETQPLLGSL